MSDDQELIGAVGLVLLAIVVFGQYRQYLAAVLLNSPASNKASSSVSSPGYGILGNSGTLHEISPLPFALGSKAHHALEPFLHSPIGIGAGYIP